MLEIKKYLVEKVKVEDETKKRVLRLKKEKELAKLYYDFLIEFEKNKEQKKFKIITDYSIHNTVTLNETKLAFKEEFKKNPIFKNMKIKIKTDYDNFTLSFKIVLTK